MIYQAFDIYSVSFNWPLGCLLQLLHCCITVSEDDHSSRIADEHILVLKEKGFMPLAPMREYI